MCCGAGEWVVVCVILFPCPGLSSRPLQSPLARQSLADSRGVRVCVCFLKAWFESALRAAATPTYNVTQHHGSRDNRRRQIVMATEATLKPLQLQVARIRQEEEDSWISGEELYTEGSSDDEGGVHAHAHAHTYAHPHPHIRIPAPPSPCDPGKCHPPKSPVETPLSTTPSAASEPAAQTNPHLTETTRRLSLMGLEKVEEGAVSSPSAKDAEEVEEQEEVMLWRPKRGSIKLPHIELDPPAPSLLEQVSG